MRALFIMPLEKYLRLPGWEPQLGKYLITKFRYIMDILSPQ